MFPQQFPQKRHCSIDVQSSLRLGHLPAFAYGVASIPVPSASRCFREWEHLERTSHPWLHAQRSRWLHQDHFSANMQFVCNIRNICTCAYRNAYAMFIHTHIMCIYVNVYVYIYYTYYGSYVYMYVLYIRVWGQSMPSRVGFWSSPLPGLTSAGWRAGAARQLGERRSPNMIYHDMLKMTA